MPKPAPSNLKSSLVALPPELLSMVIKQLRPADKVNLKYTSSYLHSWIQVKCQVFKGPRKTAHINRLHRDMGSLPAAVICPHCATVRLRSLVHRGPFGTWALKRLTWREQLNVCCQARKPRNLPMRVTEKPGNVTALKSGSESIINVQQPGMALILICLHCK